ncbi:hypothetical protein [Corynebacterium pacaense]|uniref:hypothetical protein n=1 Tax=Corynebacterium pacaense TaxID=1816684 RepID=UPI0009BBD6CF|nr:hypothetical protein [Corynebacterium pacaense]
MRTEKGEIVRSCDIEEKQATELRLLTASVFFTAVRDATVRSVLLDGEFTQHTPVLPASPTALLADVREDLRSHIDNGSTRVVVPFLSGSPFALSVLTLDGGDIDRLDSSDTVCGLFEVRSPKKHWSLESLYRGNTEGLRRITRTVDRLTRPA